MLSSLRSFDYKRIVLALCAGIIVLIIQADRRVSGQDALPVVSLVSVEPSPVREGDRLRIEVRIAPPLPSDATENDRIRGGILVYDSTKGPFADALIAFVFRAGHETREHELYGG